MTKTESIRARLEPELKAESEAVLTSLGLSMTEAITLFLKQVALRKGLPFDVKIPNAETQAAIEALETGKDVETFDSFQDFLKTV